MSLNAKDLVKSIEEVVLRLQRQLILTEDQLHESQNQLQNLHENYALKMIDILDMLDMLSRQLSSEGYMVIKKVVKRLHAILEENDIQEIVFFENKIETGKARVLETRYA